MAFAVVVDALRQLAAEVTTIDVRDLALGFPGSPQPPGAERLKSATGAADRVVLATPEPHRTFCAGMKLDLENMVLPPDIKNKPVVLFGVASGMIGALKSLKYLRSVASHMGALVLSGLVSIARVHTVFDDEERITDPKADMWLLELAN
jgi:NAD(P)H-dependent FMN reductase